MPGQISIGEWVATGQPIEAVLAGADVVAAFVAKAFDIMAGNPFLSVLVASGLVGVGVRLWQSARRAAH